MKAQIISSVAVWLALGTLAPASGGQHEGHQIPAVAGGCDQAAQQAAQTLDVLNARLEAARQTNSPSQMRAAMDDLQATLGSIRAQLSGCSPTAGASGTMPAMQHGTQGSPAVPQSGVVPVSPNAQPAAPAVEPAPSVQSQTRSNAVGASSRVEITLNTQPTPLQTGANQFEVTVRGADGKPISDARHEDAGDAERGESQAVRQWQIYGHRPACDGRPMERNRECQAECEGDRSRETDRHSEVIRSRQRYRRQLPSPRNVRLLSDQHKAGNPGDNASAHDHRVPGLVVIHASHHNQLDDHRRWP